MALYPDLTRLQSSIWRLAEEVQEEECDDLNQSDSDDDWDYVPVRSMNAGNKENQEALPLPLPPKLPQKQTPQIPPRATSAVYTVPSAPYAKVGIRETDKRKVLSACSPHSGVAAANCDAQKQTGQGDQIKSTAPTPPPRSITKQANAQDQCSVKTDENPNHEDEDVYGTKATGKQDIIQWFNRTQSPSIRDKNTSIIPAWFHGLITRDEAECRLENEPIGCFLMRFSESRFGYSLSIRAEDKIRHYMIDKKRRNYLIVNEAFSFNNLRELVMFYKENNVSTWDGKLTKACGEGDPNVVYDNRMGIRRKVESIEQPNSSSQLNGITPNMISASSKAPARPPRSHEKNPRGAPPLPPGRMH